MSVKAWNEASKVARTAESQIKAERTRVVRSATTNRARRIKVTLPAVKCLSATDSEVPNG
jgi:hypothetical protein